MSERTNEEKLRILQDRLATIQNKNETEQQIKTEQNKPVAPVFKEELVNQPTSKPIKIQDTKERTFNFKYYIIFFIIALVAYGGFEAYNSINFNELFSSETKWDLTLTKEVTTDKKKEITYHKSEFDGNYLIILNDFEDVTKANAEVHYYKNKGYKCDVLMCVDVSDCKEETIQTYIGPFNKLEEANQYLNSTISIKESGNIIELK